MDNIKGHKYVGTRSEGSDKTLHSSSRWDNFNPGTESTKTPQDICVEIVDSPINSTLKVIHLKSSVWFTTIIDLTPVSHFLIFLVPQPLLGLIW